MSAASVATSPFEPVLLSCLPHRQRWHVPSILNSPRLAASVEVRLRKTHPSLIIAANSLTGRVLLECAGMPRNTRGMLREALSCKPMDDGAYLAFKAKRKHSSKPHKLITKLSIGGAKLLLLAANWLVWGSIAGSPIATPLVILSISGTIITGYDFLRALIRTVTGQSGITTGTLVGAATVSSLMLRENVTALVVLWLLNLGEYLELLTLRRTRTAIRHLLSTEEDEAWLIQNGVEVSTRVADVELNQLVLVRSGRRIPVDGVIDSGEAFVNQAPITGESMPVKRVHGETVYAGTVLVSGSLKVRVSGVGSDTVVGRIIQRVEEAQALRPRIQTVGDAFAKKVVPSSFAAALLVFVVTRDPRRALTMMLVACPCAAGLATPTAVSASIGNGARRGILIKGGTHLEAMAAIDTVCFDKTGTLTESHPTVGQVIPTHPDYDERRVLALASRVERHSQHPLAKAVVEEARKRLRLDEPATRNFGDDNFEILSGRGVRIWTADEEILAGNERLLLERGLTLNEEALRWKARLAEEAATCVFVVHQSQVVGLLTVVAAVRAEASESIRQLRDAGVKSFLMLTGDSEAVAKAVAKRVGVDDWRSGLLPRDKFEAVDRLRGEGHKVAMIGDGINDAPALANADVGIAIGTGGSDVAIETADVALAADDLRLVSSVIHLSRQTMSVIRQNYGIALGTNSIGLYLAAMGSINPIVAAVLHNLSTILVIGNSTRLIGYNPTIRSGRLPDQSRSTSGTEHRDKADSESSSSGASRTEQPSQKGLEEDAA